MEQGLIFFDIGTTYGWAILAPSGRVFSGQSQLKGTAGLRAAAFRAEIAPAFRALRGGRYGYELFRGNFKSRDAIRSMFGLETGLLEVADLYGYGAPSTIPPTTLKKWATGKGDADKAAMIAASRAWWKLGEIGEDEGEALLGLAWMMRVLKREAAFPCRPRQPSIASVVDQL